MALRIFKCPFCGYRFQDDPEKRYLQGIASIYKGEDKPRPPGAPKKRSVDLACPNCEGEFEVELEV